MSTYDDKVTTIEDVDYPSDELDDPEAAAVEVPEFQAETLDASQGVEEGGYAEDNVGGKVRLDDDRGRPMPPAIVAGRPGALLGLR
jgi:hypothetical protein